MSAEPTSDQDRDAEDERQAELSEEEVERTRELMKKLLEVPRDEVRKVDGQRG